MRHGQSKANVMGLIVSDPSNGIHTDYALSDQGRMQVVESAQKTRLGKDTIIYSSDFSRARETASIVCRQFGVEKIHITHALRERNFGDYEKTDHGNYQLVWSDDAVNSSHKNNKVESVDEVIERTTTFIQKLEKTYNNQDILLVSHGDTLQILQTSFQNVDGSKHRSLPHLKTAEIRELQFKR